MLFSWTPDFVPNKIFIFGCGGTGSRVVPLVAQFIKSCPWVLDPEIILVDFDRVEEKNLLRQNFISRDVGHNKAVVLANRYSAAFNINMSAYTSRLNTFALSTAEEREVYSSIGDKLSQNIGNNNIFVMCVDSPEARREILNSLKEIVRSRSTNLLIDGGNENDFGQVVISSTNTISEPTKALDMLKEIRNDSPIEVKIPYIPLNNKYYSEMKHNATPSCADLDQTMAINTMVAVNIFGLIQNVYYVKPISFHRINISLQHGCTLEYMQPEYLRKCSYKEGGDNTLYKAISEALEQQEEWDASMKPAEKTE